MMSRSRSCVRHVAGIAALLLAGAMPAHAQLKNCSNLNANPGDYKVVLDDFAFASPAAKENAQLAALRDRLQFNFNDQLLRLKESARKLNETLQVPMRLVFCAGRQPAIDGSDFTDALAERLSDERVVVEMWGRLDLNAAGGAAAPIARIGYVIPPVQHYVDDDTTAPPVHLLDYPKSGTTGSVSELETLRELSAFALVGLATKAARADLYDLAVWAFNRAEANIVDAKVTNPGLSPLHAYVKRARCETGEAARKDVNYKGTLTLVSAEQCGVEL
jgi:hypothetical protein